MGKSVLECFCTSSGDRESSFQLSTKDLDAFYCSYSEELNQLVQSLSHGSESLQWSVDAMKILKKMQVELLVLIRNSNLPISSGAEDGWFNQYMKDSISMLDFCNSLKFAVSRVDRFRMMVDIMIKKLNKNGFWCTVPSETIEFERLEIERQKYSIAKMVKETVRKGSRDEDEGSSAEAINSVIVSPVSIELDGCDLEVIDGIEDKERFFTSLELLRTSSVELKEGIELLDAAVDDVFDVVIRGRNEMLGVVRDRDLSIG